MNHRNDRSIQEILDSVEALKEPMIASVRRMVRIASVETEALPHAPYGPGVKAALEEALSISAKLGFETVNLDHHIGYAQYGRGETYVCAIGHVDVVPAGEGWKQPPFSGYMDQGRIYGRGVLDNKGPIMACLYGLTALKNLGLPMKHPVRIIFGCDEESGFEDLAWYLSREKPPIYGFTPDCKYPVVYSERGRAILRLSGPVEQINSFFSFLNTYFMGAGNTGDRLGIDVTHEEYGVMEMRGYRLGTADEGKAITFDVTLSYPGGVTIASILDQIQTKTNPEQIQAVLVHNYDPVIFEKESPMVQALKESYEAVTGQDGTPVTTTGGTYAKAMSGIVPFGPSFPGQKGISHNPNEWMTVEDLMTNAKIYALALYRLACLEALGE